MPKHHHKPETQTHFFRRHRGMKFVLDYMVRELKLIVTAAIVTGISATIGGCNHFKETTDAKWIGVHLDQKQQQIDDIKDK
jgi:hypothetical protein